MHAYRFSSGGNLLESFHLEYCRREENITSRLILGKWDVRMGAGRETVSGSCPRVGCVVVSGSAVTAGYGNITYIWLGSGWTLVRPGR